MNGVDLQSWLGRTESVSEPVGEWRAAAMAATLDRPAPRLGDPLPLLWHWMYCVSAVPQAALAEDGHAQRGEFMPPVPHPLRMWAGSSLEFGAGIRVGDQLRRDSEIVAIRETAGRSGDMVFVTLENRYSTERGLAIRERQDLVYRHRPDGKRPSRAHEPPGIGAEAVRSSCPDERLLFRYSALTFNTHRIHYDADYARQAEGYPGLLVHGPLLATLLMGLWAETGPHPALHSLVIRALAPAFAGEQLELCVGEPAAGQQTLWARQPSGAAPLRIDLDF